MLCIPLAETLFTVIAHSLAENLIVNMNLNLMFLLGIYMYLASILWPQVTQHATSPVYRGAVTSGFAHLELKGLRDLTVLVNSASKDPKMAARLRQIQKVNADLSLVPAILR